MANNLSELAQGESAIVLDVRGEMRKRLRDMGLIDGAAVTCMLKSPLGDPMAYLIKGALIALRSEDSSCVAVRITS